MKTVRDIRRQATRDLRRRIFQKSIFHHKRMKDMAQTLARKYSTKIPPGNLRALARHDTWLKTGRPPRSEYRGEKIGRIKTELFNFLKAQLCILVDSFWEGRTSAEFVVQFSSMELLGFFNGKRPPSRGANVISEERPRREIPHERQRAPYA